MATDVTIGGNGELFVDEDKIFELEVLDRTGLVPTDVAGWNIVFDVRAKDDSAEPALLSKTGTVSGVFNINPALNTQRVYVEVTETEMHQFKGSNLPSGAKTYRHSWKRMDVGHKTVLSRGTFGPEKATGS